MEQPENNDIPRSAAASTWDGLKVRAISSAVLALITIGAWWQGGWIFTLFIILAAQMMVREWNTLTEDDSPAWRIAGLFYSAVPCASMIWLRSVHFENFPQAGMWLVLYLLLCIWATDIGAYFTGRKIGGAKLAPTISPGKTWAGLGGGMGAALVVGGLAHFFVPFPATLIGCALLGVLLAVVSQAGDLFESWMKRRAGVKDSGTLIPGHGGLLDRVDGIVFTAPLFAIAVGLSGLAM